MEVEKIPEGVYKAAITKVAEGKMCSDKKAIRKILTNTKAEW